ncbi:MAG: leucine-rich repeat domain-containing protein [Bacilli bacterium]|nr:leucine-rich repeat domain-containing protein [Bacilli bacterium]
MRINKYLLSLALFLTSATALGYASWQFNDGKYVYSNGLLGITSNWYLNISMDENGKVYDGNSEVGYIVYEDGNDLEGGTVTSDFVYLDNNELAIHSYLASQLGSNIHLLTTPEVSLNLPKAIHNDETGKDIPISGIDHLGTYTTIGGPLFRRYIYISIPSGYEFIGNYAFYLTGSDHADSCIEYNIPSTVSYIGHEAFNFSTLNHMKDMHDQKYKFRVNYEGTASEFIELINNSKELYESKYVGVKKDEMEAKAQHFQEEVDDTGGIIYSGSTSYSWFFRPQGQYKSGGNSNYWPAQGDYIDVHCGVNPETGKKEIVRYHAESPIAEECVSKMYHYSEEETVNIAPQIIEIDY